MTSKPVYHRPPKSYRNREFLNSEEARPIRILSEYLHPLSTFEKEGVTDTVVFFGSARIPAPEQREEYESEYSKSGQGLGHFVKYYEDACELSRRITEWSMKEAEPVGRKFLSCTGGGPGIMEASNRGAEEAGGKSIGLNIDLPMEQNPNPYISQDLSFDFHYFFTRKYWFLYFARALIVFPGGFGTLDELFETLTLQQTHNIGNSIPVYLYGKNFWDNLINFDLLAEAGLISKSDLELFQKVDSVDEAFDAIVTGLKRLL